jgi:hypothetical protein
MRKTEEKNGKRLIGKIVNGTLDISNQDISSLSCIGVQPTLEALILNGNNLESFESLQPQPNLKVIFAANNPIKFIDGLDQQPKLENLDISDTPASQQKHFRYKILGVLNSLKTLNGKEVTPKEKQMGINCLKKYPDEMLLSSQGLSNLQLTQVNQSLQAKMYMSKHQKDFVNFTKNEAILMDLNKNGPIPIIDEQSTDLEIKKAIINLRKRSEYLKTISSSIKTSPTKEKAK